MGTRDSSGAFSARHCADEATQSQELRRQDLGSDRSGTAVSTGVMTDWYWDLERKRAVTADERGPGDHTLGPYRSKGEAENWKSTVEARNQSWDDDDEAWNDDSSARQDHDD